MFRITIALLFLVLGMTLISSASFSQALADNDRNDQVEGAVFVATNSVDDVRGNEMVMYHRAKDGTLDIVGRFPTGGQGSGPGTRFRGDGLGSGNSIVLSKNHKFLFTVNAMSNSVSAFRVHKHGLELTDVVDSGGEFPVSVAVHNRLVYVLNSGGDGNITGYKMSRKGELTRLEGSTRGIDANQSNPPDALFNPAQVSFTPKGKQLVVTIKDGPDIPEATGPGRILVFSVGRNGRPSDEPVITESDNRGPFAFSFDDNGNLIVADFVGGPELTGAATSYKINDDGTLDVISLAVANGQIDSCWIVNNGRFAYAANFGTNNISSYTVGDDGSLTLLAEEAAHTDTNGASDLGAFPIDLGVSKDGRFLYLVQPGAGKIGAWKINNDGSLTDIGEFGGLEPTPDIPDSVFIDPFSLDGGSPAGIAIADFGGGDDDDDEENDN